MTDLTIRSKNPADNYETLTYAIQDTLLREMCFADRNTSFGPDKRKVECEITWEVNRSPQSIINRLSRNSTLLDDNAWSYYKGRILIEMR